MALNNMAFIFFWLIIFRRIGGDIGGYGFQEVMFLWSLAAAGIGLATVTMGNASHLSRAIYTGELDVYLLQPKPIIPNFVASRMNVSGWGDLIYGVFLFIFTQTLSLPHIALFVMFSLMCALVFASIQIFYHSLTFFLGRAEEFAQTVTGLTISFVLYPGSIFRGPVRWLLHSLIPAALVAYIPARLFNRFDPLLFAAVAAADAAFAVLAVFLFRLGLRRYESGNLMGTRL
jgi:ABC-2 type transport system permease protein